MRKHSWHQLSRCVAGREAQTLVFEQIWADTRSALGTKGKPQLVAVGAGAAPTSRPRSWIDHSRQLALAHRLPPGLGLPTPDPPRRRSHHHGARHLRAGPQLHLHVQLRAGNRGCHGAFSCATVIVKLDVQWLGKGLKEGMTAFPAWTIMSDRHLQENGRIGEKQKISQSRNFLSFLRFPVQADAFLHLQALPHLSAQQLHIVIVFKWIEILSRNQTFPRFWKNKCVSCATKEK